MPSLARLSKNNTTVRHDLENNKKVITLHSTDIVSFDDNTITLNNGGWFTATTVTRMNHASNEFGLGYRAFRLNGEMFVLTRHDEKLNFVNGKVSFRR